MAVTETICRKFRTRCDTAVVSGVVDSKTTTTVTFVIKIEVDGIFFAIPVYFMVASTPSGRNIHVAVAAEVYAAMETHI